VCSINCFKAAPALFFGAIICLLSFSTPVAGTENQFDHLIDNGGFIVKGGKVNLQYRAEEPFIPASTIKILTCLAALETLGEDYRFETHFFLDEQQNLYIKGFGDPFLTSEVIKDIAKKLYKMGVKQLLSIRLDETSYAVNSLADGAGHSKNPFDAPNSALAVNFNSVPVFVSDGGVITSGEAQTPDIPIMYEIASGLSAGTHRINVGSLLKKEGISSSLRYTGELISALFSQSGITIENGFYADRTPNQLRTIYIHSSEKTVRDIVRSCLKYSSNYIANQLYLACGTVSYGFPASWEKSRRLLKTYTTEKFDLPESKFNMVEGSGLSRKNLISPAGLVEIVEHFKPYGGLLNLKGENLLKSGTLSDVFCYAGFIVHHDQFLPFAIMLNQKENNRDALLNALQMKIQEKML